MEQQEEIQFDRDKVCYPIGEAAEMLGESIVTVRFWSDKFAKYVKPFRSNNGHRFYYPQDIEMLKRIQFYIRERGMTGNGVNQLLKDNRQGNDNRVEVVERLKGMKSILEEIQKNL